MKKLLLIACTALASCSHYLQPDKVQASLLSATYKDAESIYIMMAKGDRNYVTYQSNYENVARGLDSLYSGDAKRNSNSALLVMDRALIKVWGEIKGFHKGRGTLTRELAKSENNYMESVFQPRVNAESKIK